MNITFDTSRQIVGPANGTNMTLRYIPRQRVITAGTASQATLLHSLFDVQTNATIASEADVQAYIGLSNNVQQATFASLTPDIATINSTGNVMYVSNGVATIQATAGSAGVVTIQVPVSQSGGLNDYAFNSFIAGSLEKHITDKINGFVGDGSNLAIYSTRGTDSTPFVRNTNCWINGVDLTCIGAYSTWFASWKPYVFPATLVSNRHFITPIK